MALSTHSRQLILADRPYECPCKKNYKSYPALFTHIKSKHDGIPPGSIKKPTLTHKRPGRPPLNFSKPTISTKPTISAQFMQTESAASIQPCKQEKVLQALSFSNLQTCVDGVVQILSALPEQLICRQRLHEITAIIQMAVFVATKRDQPKKSIGAVIQQFFETVAGRVEWIKFKYFYILMMLFSQYIIKKRSSNRIFYDEEPDLLCSYINNFVEQPVEQMIYQYKVQALPIFQRQSMLKLFYWFFRWMLLKQYTTYQITFKENAKIYAY